MNKPTQLAQDYLAAMPLTAERSEALKPQPGADDAQAFEALHRKMGADDANVNTLSADDVTLASVKTRIEDAWPDAVSDKDFDTDVEG
ncbi:MAG: glucan biosynthesis glucosyltransferase H, partial [Serratia liquefaciens]|nr:glucan biosynthesis glucosyltransferase H [Serratia liquefaciens]